VSPLLAEAVPGAVTQVVVPVQNPAPPPGQGEEFGKASPVALVVIILLGLVTVMLIRSMTKRIRRLPASFNASGEPSGDAAEGKGQDEEKAGGDAADAGNGRA
jgi:hypothetical protein